MRAERNPCNGRLEGSSYRRGVKSPPSPPSLPPPPPPPLPPFPSPSLPLCDVANDTSSSSPRDISARYNQLKRSSASCRNRYDILLIIIMLMSAHAISIRNKS
uniref:Uncharacterized protein n=1 Tax=Vespula pensylvanica TaxID=30213 RepID=A0A834P0Y6_VESPE|nr:hypothetical protein H0235_008670 [Vespula pensylvanica]